MAAKRIITLEVISFDASEDDFVRTADAETLVAEGYGVVVCDTIEETPEDAP